MSHPENTVEVTGFQPQGLSLKPGEVRTGMVIKDGRVLDWGRPYKPPCPMISRLDAWLKERARA